jgi:type I restriction enzyme S subunit
MSLQSFFATFALLADAPNGASKLRELILQLAVEGKLVSQYPSDEPASKLLQKIKANKDKLAKEKRISKDVEEPIFAHELPFAIPDSWHWIRLSQITNAVHYGYTASANHALTQVRLLRITDIQNGRVNWSGVPGCEIDEEKLEGVKLSNNDILIARTGGTIGKSYIVEDLDLIAVFASYLIRAIPNENLFARYLKIFLESELYWSQLSEKSMGTGQPNVNATSLKSLVVPLPPLEEQKRIVAKVDELTGLCDELERQQEAKRKSRMHLNNATLAPLNKAASLAKEEFEQASTCLADNFATLYDSAETVNKLRSTVLQLAVQGKLVTQDPNDKPASDLLEALKANKAKLIAKRNLRTGAEDPHPRNQISQPYPLPSTWQWCRISDFAIIRGGKRLPQGAAFSATPTPHIYIQVTNMKKGTIVAEGLKYIDGEVFQQIKQYTIDSDDIYITIAGTIGQSGEIPKFFHGMNLTENAAKLMFRGLNKEYLLVSLQSSTLQRQFVEKTNQMAQPKLALKRIGAALVPLPPIEEQQRIVAKVNQLMALCDELETKLHQSEADREKLMNAAVHHVLSSIGNDIDQNSHESQRSHVI